MMNLIEQARQKSVTDLSNLIGLLQEVSLPTDFSKLLLSTNEILDEDFVKKTAKDLPVNGKHIYYFKSNNVQLVADDYNKRNGNISCKYAKYNGVSEGSYIYVGSCASIKLGNRFRQHCGWKDAATYSLQLRYWLSEEVEFTFAYARLDVSQDVLQQLEDSLSKIVKPMFGKLGANNKGKS